MNLQCPIKEAQHFGWQHTLKGLGDFLKCVTQHFGENPDYYAQIGIKGHNGWDIPYEDGTEVFASHDGTAFYTQDSSRGLGVAITNKQLKVKTIYWHFKEATHSLNTSWEVKRGDLIGYGDSTGFSTGPHLHWGIKLLDDNGNVLNRDNGFDGAVDPAQFTITWWDSMTKEQVRQLQALEGYKDEAGVDYWEGKALSAYLEARLKDKVKTINELL